MSIPLWMWCVLAASGSIIFILFMVRGNAFDAPGKATLWGIGGMFFCAMVPWAHSIGHALIVTVMASLAGCLDLEGT